MNAIHAGLTLHRDAARGPDSGIHYWLFDSSDTPVAYAKVYDNYNGETVSLCDIEVRESERRKGYARAILELIAREFGVLRVCHDGGYTLDGCEIAHLLDRGAFNETEAHPTFDSMAFVADWNTQTRRFN